MADSNSRLEEETLARGAPRTMTTISGCRWILDKKQMWQEYKPRDDKTVTNGLQATLSPTATTILHLHPIKKTRYEVTDVYINVDQSIF